MKYGWELRPLSLQVMNENRDLVRRCFLGTELGLFYNLYLDIPKRRENGESKTWH